MHEKVLVIACGAIARELVQLKQANAWEAVDIQCLPPELHNRPENIPGAVRQALQAQAEHYRQVFVAYADCGTGGALDAVLAPMGIQRLPGAHCYEFFAGSGQFSQLADEEPGTFYLTDFLVRHFDRLVIQGLGLDRHPQLRDSYFGNYRRLVYLSQSDDPELEARARGCAQRLQLDYQRRHTGMKHFARSLERAQEVPWQN